MFGGDTLDVPAVQRDQGSLPLDGVQHSGLK